MKMRHCFASLIVAFGCLPSTFAQQTSGMVYYPVKNQDGKNKYNMAFRPNVPSVREVSIRDEAFEEEKSDNYIAKLRQGLYELQLKEAENHPKNGHVTLKKFSTESATFFVALAAVQIQSLIIEYSDNPSGLAQHLSSLKDPIANLSFYLFMVANGQTVNFLQKGTDKLDPASKARAMKRIGYLGMAAGSLASGLGSEILTGLKDCGRVVFLNENERKMQLAGNNAEDFKKNLSACEAAKKAWSGSAKVQQYIPQIAALLASTELSQFIEVRGKQLMYMGPAQLAKAVAAKVGSAFESYGLQIVFAAAPGGFAIRSVAFLGKVTQFAAFTYVDHVINPYIQKFFTNQFKPLEFSFDARDFEVAMVNGKKSQWKDQRSNEMVAKELGDMTSVLKDWRQKQLTKFYTAHSIWGENTLRVIEQTSITYGFYKTYIENLFATLKTGERIRTGELPNTAMNNVSYYPFRTLPLYGVRVIDKLPEGYSSAEDLYLMNPRELENYQLKTIAAVNERLKFVLAKNEVKGADRQLLTEITQAFSDKNLNAIGAAILKLNEASEGRRTDMTEGMVKLMGFARQSLGYPTPILTAGMAFSYAFERNSFNTLAMEKLERPAGAGFDRRRTSDYLWMQMACGSENKYYSNPWGMKPSFLPPKLLRSDILVPDLCQEVNTPALDKDGRETTNIYETVYRDTKGKSYKGINDLIYQNLRPEVLGEFTSPTGQHKFGEWWEQNVSAGTVELFRTFDADYVHVLANLTDNWNNKESTYLDRLNRSSYLHKDALENLSFELNIYATVLNEILSLQGKPDSGDVAAVKAFNLKAKRNAPKFVASKNGIDRKAPTSPDLLLRLKGASEASRTAAEKTQEIERLQAQLSTVNQQRNDLMSARGSQDKAKIAIATKEIARLEGLLASAQKTASEARAQATLQPSNSGVGANAGPPMVKELAELVAGLQERIDLLRKIKVSKEAQSGRYEIANFPEKEDSKLAMAKTEDAMKALSEMIDHLNPEQATANKAGALSETLTIGPTQMRIIEKAVAGLDSVIEEVGSLTMAFYTTKYHLEDQYEDIINEQKRSRNETPKKLKTGSFNPYGG